MFQIRIHGRGGQGVVTAAEMLSIAAFIEGKFAQAFPSFGSERMGAPVVAFCRISESEIRVREPILEPDVVIVQDQSLVSTVDVFAGLKTGCVALINATHRDDYIDSVAKKLQINVHYLNATEIALQYVGRPIPNAALLGGFSACCPHIVQLKSIKDAIFEKFSGSIAEKNSQAAERAFEKILEVDDV